MLTVLVFWSCVLLLPRLPPSSSEPQIVPLASVFASWALGHVPGSAARNSPTTRAKTGCTAQAFTAQGGTRRIQKNIPGELFMYWFGARGCQIACPGRGRGLYQIHCQFINTHRDSLFGQIFSGNGKGEWIRTCFPVPFVRTLRAQRLNKFKIALRN